MQLTKTGANQITIEGNIKTIEDYLAIKKIVTSMVDAGSTQIVLIICNSISMPSSVLGFFVKLVNQDNIRVSMQVVEQCLYELLEELGMVGLFNVKIGSSKTCCMGSKAA